MAKKVGINVIHNTWFNEEISTLKFGLESCFGYFFMSETSEKIHNSTFLVKIFV